MAVSPSRKMSAAATFFLLFFGIVVAFTPAFFYWRTLRTFCEDLAPGATLAEVQAQAEKRNLEVPQVVDGGVVIEHPRLQSRPQCILQFDAEGKLASRVFDTN
jgi:hypothetical protein